MKQHNDHHSQCSPIMNKLTLVILAAGMGSRYGGLKQLDPVGPHGEVLLDYSVHDALLAGFNEIVFVIRKEIETAFQEHVSSRYAQNDRKLKIRFAFQELDDLPKKDLLPLARSKPWGTGHALLAARHLITSPFAVINADDYYGPSGYRLLKDFLLLPASLDLNQKNSYAMIAYALKNTLSEHGAVSRGVCKATKDHDLIEITECTSIRQLAGGIVTEEKDTSILSLTGEESVSLNFWGFTPDIFPLLENEFLDFVTCVENQTTAEFYLPTAINRLIDKKKISVKLLPTKDLWLGLTHPADITHVQEILASIDNQE